MEEVLSTEWTGRIENSHYVKVHFSSLTIRNAKIRNVTFLECRFRNCYIAFNVTYEDCLFKETDFSGKYASLGNPKGKPSKFIRCSFINCNITGTQILDGTVFNNCIFNSRLRNIILRNAYGKLKNLGTRFEHCDLSNSLFENISVYGNKVFANTKLPLQGLRLYRNRDGELIQKARNKIAEYPHKDTIECAILFSDLRKDQDPIILDEYFLNSFLKDAKSREIFDSIVDGHLVDGAELG